MNMNPSRMRVVATSSCNKLSGWLLVSALSVLMTACKATITEPEFQPVGGSYENAQTLSIVLPTDATNVYLTTDMAAPEPSDLCTYAGEAILVDRPTVVKLRYDQAGETKTREQRYIIRDNISEHGYKNRKIIEVWESFFVKNVLRAFSPPDNEDSSLVVEDGKGGVASLQTAILSRTPFTKVPDAGEQLYGFSFFERPDADTGDVVRINRGAIYGYRNKNGGYYTTLPRATQLDVTAEKAERLYFAGTYTGWAEGDFRMDTEGRTVAGYYEVHCQDAGCADTSVIYTMDQGMNRLIEMGPARHENTRSCTPPVVNEVIVE